VLLETFARAVARRPFSLEDLKEAREKMRATLGEGALVEAASAAAGMELATRGWT